MSVPSIPPVTIFQLPELSTIAETHAIEVEINNVGNYYLTLQRLRDWIGVPTSVAGTNGQYLSLVNSVPTWTTVGNVIGLNSGTNPNNVVVLDNNGYLPILDARNLTNFNASNISSGTLNIARLGDLSVTTSKLADSSITTSKLTDSSITTSKLTDSSVTTSKLADSSITINKLNTTGTANSTTFLRGDGKWETIANDTIGVTDGDKGDVVVSNNGSTWTIDTGVVTFPKIQNITSHRLLGRYSCDNGSIQELQIGSGLTLVNDTLSASTVAITTLIAISNTLALSNTRYLCNTSINSFTITLPASPENGDLVEIADFNNSSVTTGFGIHSLTITANTGHNIAGTTNLVLDRGGQAVALVFHSNRWSIVSGIGEGDVSTIETSTDFLADFHAIIVSS